MAATLTQTELIKCPCCDRGYIDAFKHIDGGVCYHCDGVGLVTETLYEAIAQKTGKPTLADVKRQEEETNEWYGTLTIKLFVTDNNLPVRMQAYDSDGNVAGCIYPEMYPLYELDEETKQEYRDIWAKAKAAGAKMKRQIVKNGIKKWIDA